jgi:hypothetical protein
MVVKIGEEGVFVQLEVDEIAEAVSKQFVEKLASCTILSSLRGD